MRLFKSYEEAKTWATEQCKSLRLDVGIKKRNSPLMNGEYFAVFYLPKPENRCGDELSCEVVPYDWYKKID